MLSYVVSSLLVVFEVAISVLSHPCESVQVVGIERQLAEGSSEGIPPSCCCTTTSPIRLRSVFLSCFCCVVLEA